MVLERSDWPTGVPALSSERVTYLALKAILDPRSMTPVEVQELAAAILAHRACFPEDGPPH